MTVPVRRRVLPLVLLAVLSGPAFAADWPAGFSKCADERGLCKVGDTPRQVSYGIRNQWVVKTFAGTVACNNQAFGADPYPGKRKKCAVGAIGQTPPPPPVVNPITEAAPASGWAGHRGSTTGGAAARPDAVFTVSSAGQLLQALKARPGQPVIVKVNGVIDMQSTDNGGPFRDADDQKARNTIKLPSNSTLIGLGEGGRVVNARIEIKGVENVIVRNLHIVNPCDLKPQADGSSWDAAYDGIEVDGAKRVWIDRNHFTDAPTTDDTQPRINGKVRQCHDGALDIKRGADFVTVSNNVFELHDKNTIVGHDDQYTADEGALRISFHGNHFRNITQRAPRVRFGQVHVYNNYYEGDRQHPVYPHAYSLGVGVKAKLISQNNAFDIAGATHCGHLAKGMGEAGALAENGSLLNGQPLEAAQCGFSRAVGWNVPYAFPLLPGAQVRDRVLRNAGVGKLRF